MSEAPLGQRAGVGTASLCSKHATKQASHSNLLAQDLLSLNDIYIHCLLANVEWWQCMLSEVQAVCTQQTIRRLVFVIKTILRTR